MASNDPAYTVRQDTQLVVPVATGVLSNDTDPENDGLIAIVLAVPTKGNFVGPGFSPDGSFTYAPNAGFVGNDTFTYQADDGCPLRLPTSPR